MKKLLPALLLTSCGFDLTRELGPGELRGTVVYRDDAGVSTPLFIGGSCGSGEDDPEGKRENHGSKEEVHSALALIAF